MRPWDYLPDSYHPPLREGIYRIAWKADLGPGAPSAVIAEYIEAFAAVTDIGERWGIVMAEEAAARSLLAELFAAADDGEPRLTPLRDEMPWQDEKAIYMAVSDLLGHRYGDHPELNVEVPSVLRRVASLSVPSLLGPAPRTQKVNYENPIEIVILGGGFMLMGAVQLLRIIRDWKQRRRIEDAAADIAAAEARQAVARAEVVEYLGKEIIAGRLHVPASELGAMLTREDISAVARLAGPEATLELPSNVSQFFGEEERTGSGD